MTDSKLTDKVLEMINAIDRGTADPLQFTLVGPYRELRAIDARLETRIEIDEWLNNILGAKVHRIQELARVLGEPELYVSRLENLRAKQVAALASYHQPLVLRRLDHRQLSSALERLLSIIDTQAHREVTDDTPELIELPSDFVFESEEAITRAEMDEFIRAMAKGTAVPVRDLMRSPDIDEFLRRFLIIIMLVAEGLLKYDPTAQTVTRVDMVARQ